MATRALGLTLEEVAAWLRYLGASEGLNLDGGGSTTLVMRDPGDRVVRVNRTVDSPITGSERVVANHLGIRVDAQ
jgi:exopolysaccharide biosynthesis protein